MEHNEDSAGQNTSSRINKAVFPSGLTEPDPLSIGENLVHVFQLPFQFRVLLLKQLYGICQRANEVRYFRGGVCTFLFSAAIACTPKK